MRVVFCGTPASAAPSLRAIAREGGFEVPLVLTQPDRPSGRGMHAAESAVKRAARELALPVLTPEKLKSIREELVAIRPDAVCVVAYGHIFRSWLLELPRLGCVNVHFSLLPRHRGVAPVAWAILEGDRHTGVTTMQMARGVDTGPVFLEERTAIGEAETAGELTARLADMAGPLLVRTLRGLDAGELAARPQDEAAATYARRLEKEDGRIDWARPAEEVARRVRGLSPWPGAFTTYRGRILKIHRARAIDGEGSLRPGEITERGERAVAATGRGAVELVQVQLEGKARMEGIAWLRGARPRSGELLGAR
jgi:methionyl-tRNA formyltransferase